VTDKELEEWSGTQRRLPVLVGLVWIIVGILVVFLAYPDFIEKWEYLPWGAVMVLGGIFVLYIRLSVLPSTRKLQATPRTPED